MTFKHEKIQDIERRSTRSHCVEKSLWKRLWPCRETDWGIMNDVSAPFGPKHVGNDLQKMRNLSLSVMYVRFS